MHEIPLGRFRLRWIPIDDPPMKRNLSQSEWRVLSRDLARFFLVAIIIGYPFCIFTGIMIGLWVK